MKRFFRGLAVILAGFSALLAAALHLKPRLSRNTWPWILKVLAGALSPISGAMGVLGGVLGLFSGAPLTLIFGGWGAVRAWRYLQEAVWPQGEIEHAFGPDWENRISQERAAHMLLWRWDWRFPAEPEPRWQRNLAFWTLENGRALLCDLWQPQVEIPPSGLALLYFHGSAWQYGDKDMGTRAVFRHLAAQGHVIMDVAYRLHPETDMAGMVGDVKRALTWMKAHAAELGVDPDNIVLMGGSAGGHLAMLAGFVPEQPEMTPLELREKDLTVRAVVSIYGPSDLAACYYHFDRGPAASPAAVSPSFASKGMAWVQQELGGMSAPVDLTRNPLEGTLPRLFGGGPEQFPEQYTLFSPINHVHPGCPPVFLAQGEDDHLVPIAATYALVRKLRGAGVKVVNLVFPLTDHAYDLVLPRLNPASRATLYELDRFLALMC